MRRIERYVRHAEHLMNGTVELGLHYEFAQQAALHHRVLLRAGAIVADRYGTATLDVATADRITRDIDAELVAIAGDLPRFIEVWSGFGDDARPLTQVYAPHGMPITNR